MQALLDQMNNKQVLSWIDDLEARFKNAPHLPKGLVDFLVKIGPYLALIGGIFSVLGGFQMLTGQDTVYRQLEMLGVDNTYRQIMGIEQILLGALYIWSFSYLKKQSFTGWLMLFWGMMITTAFSILMAIMYGMSLLVGTAIGLLIGLYILFELKPHYKK